MRLWWIVVKLFGGFHERGRWAVIIADSGVTIAKNRVVVWDWPPRR